MKMIIKRKMKKAIQTQIFVNMGIDNSYNRVIIITTTQINEFQKGEGIEI